MKTLLCVAMVISSLFSAALVAEIRVSGHIGGEQRYFPESALYPMQDSNQSSIFGQVELYWQAPDGNDSLTITPFSRKDFSDDNRSHNELKEAYWLHIGETTELSLGSKIVFWGVTESRHLVDIINQTDFIESPDGEDKLGQPMAQLSWIADWGSIDFFVLPYFREPLYAGEKARLRMPWPVSEQPLYQSSQAQNHHDFALRLNQSIGDWDLGLSAFKGTSRTADLIPLINGTKVVSLIPYHRQITQLSIDLQATIDDFLWKFEAIQLKQKSLNSPVVSLGALTKADSYFAATAGFEYTLVGVNDSESDLGLLLEYNYDQRDNSPFANNAFVATRWALNDFGSSEVLAGINVDLDNNSHSALIEASTRFGDSVKVSLEAWLFESNNQQAPIYLLRRDDFIALDIRYYF